MSGTAPPTTTAGPTTGALYSCEPITIDNGLANVIE
jgi:hypothetical protein